MELLATHTTERRAFQFLLAHKSREAEAKWKEWCWVAAPSSISSMLVTDASGTGASHVYLALSEVDQTDSSSPRLKAFSIPRLTDRQADQK